MAHGAGFHEIVSGVRRTKALQVAGHQSALALVDTGGVYFGPTLIPIADLRVISSNKRTIDASSSSVRQKRWLDLLTLAKSSASAYPFRDAIIVQPISPQRASRGKQIRDVDVT